MNCKALAVALLCLALTGCNQQPITPVSQAMPGRNEALSTTCTLTWGSAGKSSGPLSTAQLFSVATAQQSCFDRLTFEFNGKAQGYSVQYADRILTEGEGRNLVPYTAGGAYLWVTLREPSTTLPPRPGDRAVNVLHSSTMRDVVYGGSFEGYTTLAVGVRARLPFRVTLAAGPGTHSRIILDVAHSW